MRPASVDVIVSYVVHETRQAYEPRKVFAAQKIGRAHVFGDRWRPSMHEGRVGRGDIEATVGPCIGESSHFDRVASRETTVWPPVVVRHDGTAGLVLNHEKTVVVCEHAYDLRFEVVQDVEVLVKRT